MRFLLVQCLVIFLISEVTAIPNRHKRDAETCGSSVRHSGFVTYGASLSRGDLPWKVALMYIENKEFFCAGTLVSKRHVITGKNRGMSSDLLLIQFLSIFQLRNGTKFTHVLTHCIIKT